MKMSANQKLAAAMLVLGAVAQLAFSVMIYNAAIGQPGHVLLPGLAWLKVLPYACWTVVLVQRPRRRWLVGAIACVASMWLTHVSETQPDAWFPRVTTARTLRPMSLPSVGQSLAFPQLRDLDGNVFDLTFYQDRPVVLSFWRSWCGPCRKEFPDLGRLDGIDTELGPVAVIGVNDEPVSIQQRVRTEAGITFRLVRDEANTVLDAGVFPTTVVLLNGKILARWTGTDPHLVERVTAAINRHTS